MRLNPNAVGTEGEPVERWWEDRDCMLYALSVGMSYPDFTADLKYTTENTQGQPLTVVPTFATVVGRNQEAEWPAFPPSPGQTFLASETITFTGPLATSGHARIASKITNIYDQGKGALLEMASVATNSTGQTIFTRDWTVFIRGQGGFGGARAQPMPKVRSDKAADFEARCVVNPISALIYRLVDSRGPVHSDPALARASGFKNPIMHGRNTLGYALQLLSRGPCEDLERMRSIRGYFTAPLEPGETVIVRAWRISDSQVDFQLVTAEGTIVIEGGRCVMD